MKSTPIKKFSNKRAAIEREYSKQYKKKLEDWDRACEGCGGNLPCTPSHYIPRSYDSTLIADPENFGFQCDKCSKLCELGDYPSLLCGLRIYEYVQRVRPQYFRMKSMSYFDRHGVEMSTQF